MLKHHILALALSLTCSLAAFGANGTVLDGQGPATTNNDDSCDIGVFPAATLLLPFFDVDINSPSSDTTIFTITNTTRIPQIAHVTIWSDWSFPVLDFNIFLTGYDVQPINLRDVLVNGMVAPSGPGTSSTNTTRSPRAPLGSVMGAAPLRNTGNPHLDVQAVIAGGSCSNLPGKIDDQLMAPVRAALTTGLYNPGVAGLGCGSISVGGVHTNARGFVTIDVVSNCTPRLADDPDYFRKDILFDNVLIGDYQQVDGDIVTGNFAHGSPMVHIRAMPEGGRVDRNTNLPYTFYDRFTPEGMRRIDRRQPLPAIFAARWIEGGAGGFNTEYKIWREGLETGVQHCDDSIYNSAMPFAEAVRFDERENSFGYYFSFFGGPYDAPYIGAAQSLSTVGDTFPDNAGTDIGGWMYLNLNNCGTPAYSAASDGFAPAGSRTEVRPSQNWVTVSMYAQGRYGVDFDAAMLGNGCSAAALRSDRLLVGPAANTTP